MSDPASKTTEVELLRSALRNACQMIVTQQKAIHTIRDGLAKFQDVGVGYLPFKAALAASRVADGAPADWDIQELASVDVKEALHAN